MAAASPAPVDSRVLALGIAGFAGLLLITLADAGATRMYAWPWSLARWVAQLAPLAALALRCASAHEPLRLPPRGWIAAWSLAVAGILVSAWASPWRGPSLLCAWTPLAAAAAFFLIYDRVHAGGGEAAARFERWAGWTAALVTGTSLLMWALQIVPMLRGPGFLRTVADFRNPYPLGHSNYTAGLALLLLPWPVHLARQARGPARAAWGAVALLDVAVLLTTGSRGGMLALGVLVGAGLWFARPGWKRLLGLGLPALGIVVLLCALNPRIRELSRPRDSETAPDQSRTQRSAMLHAGWRMGRDRPWFGWGPGATPLAYPRYRAGLDGGVEDALELHSSPLQLWAEGGAIGLLAALALGALALGALAVAGGGPSPPAAMALAGYAAFALTDWQLDVPIFAFAVAAALALLAPPPPRRLASLVSSRVIAAAVLACMGLVAAGERADPTPALNVRALGLARNPSRAADAIALLKQSLASNPEQEIAHFNLGWLQVVRDPAAAEKHFAAAALLVPDKGGVYFGLGLARLNQNRPDSAADAFALECLNDPLFLTSPWWRVPELARVRAPTLARLSQMQRETIARLPQDRWPAAEARYDAALTAWFAGAAPARSVAAFARTPQRRDYFLGNPSPPDPAAARLRTYRRERTGYPVLMRNLDLEPPLDLYDVEEDARFAVDRVFLFPEKGWLPTPLLVSLLKANLAAKI